MPLLDVRLVGHGVITSRMRWYSGLFQLGAPTIGSIRWLLHLGPAHTTGDTAIYFKGTKAAHVGDVYNKGFFSSGLYEPDQ